jgi:hypothetical protein
MRELTRRMKARNKKNSLKLAFVRNRMRKASRVQREGEDCEHF